MAIFVTGGAGFIGSQFIRDWVRLYPAQPIMNFDSLTYAGNLENLASVASHPSYSFVKGDVCEPDQVLAALPQGCDAVVHFAAESHVDRSILSAAEFVRTNVLGTQVMLDAARARGVRRFLHISTDEVGGSIPEGQFFREDGPLAPSSPYAASKTAAEHLVRAAAHTFGLDVVLTRTSNNYGPYQFPEKLIPLALANALEDRPIPVYSDGLRCAIGFTSPIIAPRYWPCSNAALRAPLTTSGDELRYRTSIFCVCCSAFSASPRPCSRMLPTAWDTIAATPSIAPASQPNWVGSRASLWKTVSAKPSTGTATTAPGSTTPAPGNTAITISGSMGPSTPDQYRLSGV